MKQIARVFGQRVVGNENVVQVQKKTSRLGDMGGSTSSGCVVRGRFCSCYRLNMLAYVRKNNGKQRNDKKRRKRSRRKKLIGRKKTRKKEISNKTVSCENGFQSSRYKQSLLSQCLPNQMPWLDSFLVFLAHSSIIVTSMRPRNNV